MKLLFWFSLGFMVLIIAACIIRIVIELRKEQPKFGSVSGDPRLRSSGRLSDEYLKNIVK